MKRSIIITTAIFTLVQLYCNTTLARPITVHEAQQAATGWLRLDPQPMETVLGGQVAKVETFNDKNGEPIYYVVYLEPAGFVIIPADDLVEPIICFADDGKYDPSPDNCLGALVTNDLNGRIATVRDVKNLEAHGRMQEAHKSQVKWGRLISLADSGEGDVFIEGLGSISDVRRSPLVQSQWSQDRVCGDYCYNYFTPNHYVCGCVATAMAQLMRYHQHPISGIGVHKFTIAVDEVAQDAYTLGGDGFGGQYNWSQMPFVPNCSLTPDQRLAIGALCYDCGVSVGMHYAESGSGASMTTSKNALIAPFQYYGAIVGYERSGIGISPGLVEMINPNLDASCPVMLAIEGTDGAHQVVCDGYGYNSSTMYHHLNMGWAGSDDAWYNLPNIDSSPAFTSVYGCVYNVRPTGVGDGEVISGRVLYANGNPIANATVYVGLNPPPPPPPPPPPSMGGLESQSASFPVITSTDSKGIYAFSDLNSNTTYYVTSNVRGYVPLTSPVHVGESRDNYNTSGNVWGADLVPTRLDFLYVDDDAPDDPGPEDLTVSDPLENGSIQHPFDSIQEAIDVAINGDEIEVESGIYYEVINFIGKAIRLYSTDGPNNTTIDATGLNSSVVTCNSVEDANTILDGFTITGGSGTTGGGMYNYFSSPTVTDCTFSGNTASDGGGIYNCAGSHPTVTNCTFRGNSTWYGSGSGMFNINSSPTVSNCTFSDNRTVDGDGGGMCNIDGSNPTVTNCNFSGHYVVEGGGMFNRNSSPTVTNCTFSDNYASYANSSGGGMYNEGSSPKVTGCTFSGNNAELSGGGMGNGGNSNPTVRECTFSDNFVNGSGGGIFNIDNSNPEVSECTFRNNEAGWGGGMCNDNSSPNVRNCIFIDNNSVGGDGGGGMMNYLSSATMANCVFLNNYAANVGGGMFNVSCSPTVTNCTFSGNSVIIDGGGMYNAWDSFPTVTNCILWGDEPNEIANNHNSNPTVTYSDVQGGWVGLGNIDADPCFVDAENPDPNLLNLRLKPDSPCIDAGDSTVVLAMSVAYDVDGKDRYVDIDTIEDTGSGLFEFLDMGAYEFDCSGIDGDVNCDGVVDFRDVAIICANWLAGTEP